MNFGVGSTSRGGLIKQANARVEIVLFKSETNGRLPTMPGRIIVVMVVAIALHA